MSRMNKHTVTHFWVSASERRETRDERRFNGSALILVVVLTSLLAIIGVVFLLSSRVDSIATSAISENKELNLAVDTVVAQISEELAADVPYSDVNGQPVQEYYDYPDGYNRFLACLEPYLFASNNYHWRHITDINNTFRDYQNLLDIPTYIIPDYQNREDIGDSTPIRLFPADADGDGVSDSMWEEVNGISSNKAKPIFAAVRVIDNGGMLNVNTGFKFDPNSSVGSSQLDVNLVSLSWRPNDPTSSYVPSSETDLLAARSPVNPLDFAGYEQGVIWKYDNPDSNYTPFDISDELEMRNRFVLNHQYIYTRLENWSAQLHARNKGVNWTPFDNSNFDEWFDTSCIDANLLPPDRDYAYRHIATTYNYDRIINPTGEKMFNVNFAANPAADKADVYQAVRGALDPNIPDANVRQITANLIDYLDSDSQVTVFVDPNDPNSKPYYGFETPCIYISELAERFVKPADPNAPVAKSYAIELYKPYTTDPTPEPNKWWLSINNPDGSSSTIPINWIGNSGFYVVWNTDVNAPLDINTADSNVVTNTDVNFVERSHIELQIEVDPNLPPLTVDWVDVPAANTKWLIVFDENDVNERTHSYQRDIGPGKCIRRLWDTSFGYVDSPTLGGPNPFSVNTYAIQEHPANASLTNIGEIGMLFRVDGYLIGSAETEADVRLDLQNQAAQQIFKYLTVIDPTIDTIDNDGDGLIDEGKPSTPELKVKGRININTAPWFVLAQLPWVTSPDAGLSYSDRIKLARAIVAYRDKLQITGGPNYYWAGASDSRQQGMQSPNPVNEYPGFASVGELLNVTQAVPLESLFPPQPSPTPFYDIRHYGRDGQQLTTFPELAAGGDGVADDFKERDVIFARISNLVTVRSDVFTAYILVRIGQDGPQKRVIAILDRSEVKFPTDEVKVLAVHPVPDPR